MNTIKVIGIGFHKTGTSTLGRALEILGYKVCDARINLAQNLVENKLDKVWEITSKYDAFRDSPWFMLYKELDSRYPGSKFVFTMRDDQTWLRSIRNHFGQDVTEMRRWIYGKGSVAGNEEIYLKRYQQHRVEVNEYFKNRPHDLLTISFEEGDSWKKLCEFLGQNIPEVEFPHVNKAASSTTENSFFHLITRRLKRWVS